MKALVELIAKSLVDIPEEVSVSEVVGERTAVFELRVAKSDIGKVIGKEGNTARAIRTILSAAGAKLNKRCVLEILEQAEQHQLQNHLVVNIQAYIFKNIISIIFFVKYFVCYSWEGYTFKRMLSFI